MIFLKRAIHSTKIKVTADEILSLENRQRTVQVLSNMKNITTEKSTQSRQAAVLVPLCLVNDQISLLFTIRSMQLKTNRGQVAYPGGMADDNDSSLLETAKRETEEEIGLPFDAIDIWGSGPSIGREDMLVTPYLAFIGNIVPTSLKLNPTEKSFLLQAS